VRDLEAELEGALLDAMQGDPWGSLLAGRLERTARAVLLRHGLGAAHLMVTRQGAAVLVQVTLPGAPRRARNLVVRLDPGP
jgi:hypothetical protein